MASFCVSVIVSTIEMMTISETGILGCIMNILSPCSFAGVASAIYKKKNFAGGHHWIGGRVFYDDLRYAFMELFDYPHLYGISPRSCGAVTASRIPSVQPIKRRIKCSFYIFAL